VLYDACLLELMIIYAGHQIVQLVFSKCNLQRCENVENVFVQNGLSHFRSVHERMPDTGN